MLILLLLIIFPYLDEDECLTAGVCGNGNCTNTEGSFQCTCPKGYAPGRYSPRCVGKNFLPDIPVSVLNILTILFSVNVSHFTDIDECTENNDLCAFRCVNQPGSYRCICPRGYELAADKVYCRGEHFFKQREPRCTSLLLGLKPSL